MTLVHCNSYGIRQAVMGSPAQVSFSFINSIKYENKRRVPRTFMKEQPPDQ
jgi:hypothetical protein